MKTKHLFVVIGNINDRFIDESAEYIANRKIHKKNPHVASWLKFAVPLAACLIIAIAVFRFPNMPTNPNDTLVGVLTTNPTPSQSSEQQPTNPNIESSTPVVTDEPFRIGGLADGQHSSKIVLNDGAYGELNFLPVNGSSADRALSPQYDPETMYQVQWGMDDVIEYLGTDFRPHYLPDDLEKYQGFNSDIDGIWTVFFNNDGTVVSFPWTFALSYSESFDDTYDPNRRRLFIEVGKGEVPFQCGLYLAESETPSNIKGNEVFVGYHRMNYGPYTYSGDVKSPETRIPAGYYDVYFAEFMYNGVGYYVEAENLSQEEFVEILLSLFVSDTM